MSLVKMLLEEGADIWRFNGEGFFNGVLAGDRKRGHWRSHEIRQQQDIFGYTNGTYRSAHEIAHLVCCRDQNVFNPWWDFNRFIDTDGIFTFEEGHRETEVLLLDAMLRYDDGETYHSNPTWFVVYALDKPHHTRPDQATFVENADRDTFLRWVDDYKRKWTLNKILDEALRKYELIRAARINHGETWAHMI